MEVRIKSPDVARRLRGFGGDMYLLDSGKDSCLVVYHARFFQVNGMDFAKLCRDGRISVRMRQDHSSKENRRLVQREIARQGKVYNKANEAISRFQKATTIDERAHVLDDCGTCTVCGESNARGGGCIGVDAASQRWSPFIPSDG